jgi:hypothetical protein
MPKFIYVDNPSVASPLVELATTSLSLNTGMYYGPLLTYQDDVTTPTLSRKYWARANGSGKMVRLTYFGIGSPNYVHKHEYRWAGSVEEYWEATTSVAPGVIPNTQAERDALIGPLVLIWSRTNPHLNPHLTGYSPYSSRWASYDTAEGVGYLTAGYTDDRLLVLTDERSYAVASSLAPAMVNVATAETHAFAWPYFQGPIVQGTNIEQRVQGWISDTYYLELMDPVPVVRAAKWRIKSNESGQCNVRFELRANASMQLAPQILDGSADIINPYLPYPEGTTYDPRAITPAKTHLLLDEKDMTLDIEIALGGEVYASEWQTLIAPPGASWYLVSVGS